ETTNAWNGTSGLRSSTDPERLPDDLEFLPVRPDRFGGRLPGPGFEERAKGDPKFVVHGGALPRPSFFFSIVWPSRSNAFRAVSRSGRSTASRNDFWAISASMR